MKRALSADAILARDLPSAPFGNSPFVAPRHAHEKLCQPSAGGGLVRQRCVEDCVFSLPSGKEETLESIL